jgi:hypothetical protein
MNALKTTAITKQLHANGFSWEMPIGVDVHLQHKTPHQPLSQYLQPSKLKHFQSCKSSITNGRSKL